MSANIFLINLVFSEFLELEYIKKYVHQLDIHYKKTFFCKETVVPFIVHGL